MKNTANKLFFSGMVISCVGLVILPLITGLIGIIIGIILFTKEEITKGIFVTITACGYTFITIFMNFLLLGYAIKISTVVIITLILCVIAGLVTWANWERKITE
jgi:hypothetical protein